jgi:hypothetical protein
MNSDPKVIKANLEYLRKLFIMPDSPDKFIEFGQDLLEMIHDFFKEKGGIRKINHLINALNIKLHKALRQDDSTFVSRTMLESTHYRPQNIVVLRAVLINPLTEPPVLQEIAETQMRLGLEIWKDFEPAYERLLG